MRALRATRRPRGLTFRLALLVLASTMAIFCAVFAYNYQQSKKAILASVEEGARHQTMATVNRIEAVLGGVEKLPKYLAVRLERTREYHQDLLGEHLQQRTGEHLLGLAPQLRDVLAANTDIFGAAVAFEPYAADPDNRLFAPYCHRGKDASVVFKNLNDGGYQYEANDWYVIPKILGRPSWSEPYFDDGGGNIVMATYSVPFYREIVGQRTFMGVVTADVSLEWLQRMVASVSVGTSGYAFLISPSGGFVTHPRHELVMRESIFSLAEASGDQDLRAVGRRMVAGGSGFVPLGQGALGPEAWLFYAPLPSMGGALGLVMPVDELFAGLRSLSRDIALMSGLGFLLLLLAVTAIARAIVRPIGMLAASSAEIAKGNLDTPLPLVRTKDEIADLSSSFERMRQALKAYIADLTETTAAKERIDSELKIAHSIQMSFLPKRFPPFPDRSEFSLHAVMEPAKAVGGDLYDYCLLGDTHLFFAIGDVSGKGVPAALFMAVTKTLLKGVAEQGTDPAEVLAKVNRELCLDNETMMFVTAICGTLDLRTGELLVSNAGHNPPLLVRNHAGDGAEWFELPAGVLLGVDEDAAYRTARSFLRPGDTLLLYTDGVTEAMDAEQAVYSDDRLLRAAAAGRTSCPEKLIGAVMADVKAHTGGVEQSDDITLLALEFHGAGPPDDGNH